jgi:hypothetical protein
MGFHANDEFVQVEGKACLTAIDVFTPANQFVIRVKRLDQNAPCF